MVKLVVADDEERVCRLILALGDWKKLGIEVAGTAANGVRALEIISREKIDILITDIRMPGYSGLELIEKVKKVSPNIKIMIISGYANFEYAQNALKQGVNDYLLKPINKEALNESLANMVKEIEKERKNNIVFQDIQNERREGLVKIRNMLLQDLIHDRNIHLTEDILRAKYCFNVKSGCFQVVAIKRDVGDRNSVTGSAEVIWEKMKEIFIREVPKECYDVVFGFFGEYLYGILNYPVRNIDKIRKVLRSSFNQMLARHDYLGNSYISMGLGSVVKNAEEIPVSLVLSVHALEERILEGTGKILSLEMDTETLFEKKLVDKFSRSLGVALQTLDTEEIKRTVEVTYQETLSAAVHGWEIQELVRQCGSIFIMRMNFPEKAEMQAEFEERCENCTTVSSLFAWLQEFVLEKVSEIITQREEESVRPVRLAKQYIHNHYPEQITLEEVSEYVGLTSAYFSVMFKKKTGIGFAKYLINERIEAAKELLRETNFSVADISRRVGYYDSKHFTRLFEKNAGVKPAVYRKLYG